MRRLSSSSLSQMGPRIVPARSSVSSYTTRTNPVFSLSTLLGGLWSISLSILLLLLSVLNDQRLLTAEGAQQQFSAVCHDSLVLDVQLLLDSSSSIGPLEHAFAKRFLRQLVQNFPVIGPNGVQIGLVSYSGFPVLGFPLNQYRSKPDVIRHLDLIEYSKGVTLTGKAIERVVKETFRTKYGERATAPNVLIILTDGWSQSSIPAAIEDVTRSGRDVDIFVVGIGGHRNYQELLELSSSRPDQIFELPSATNRSAAGTLQMEQTLQQLMGRLVDVYAEELCPEMTTSTTIPATELAVERQKSNCPVWDCSGNAKDAFDLVIVLPDMTSYSAALKPAIRLVNKITENLPNIGMCGTQIGLMMGGRRLVRLNQSLADLIRSLGGLRQLLPLPSIPITVDALYDQFKLGNGGRSNVAQIILAVQDERGYPINAKYAFEQIAAGTMFSRNLTVATVQIGSPANGGRYSPRVEYNYELNQENSNGDLAALMVRTMSEVSKSVHCGLVIGLKPPGEATILPATTTTAASYASRTDPIYTTAALPTTERSRTTSERRTVSSPAPPTTTSKENDDCQGLIDVVFLVDSSSSISREAHQRVLGFISRIVESFPTYNQRARFGMVQYSDQPYIQFYLNTYTDAQRPTLIGRIRATDYMKGATWTAKAVQRTIRGVFHQRRGDRPEAGNILIVLTDGWSQDNLQTAFDFARNENVRIIAAAIGADFDERQLKSLAGYGKENLVRLPGPGVQSTLMEQQTQRVYQHIVDQLELEGRKSCQTGVGVVGGGETLPTDKPGEEGGKPAKAKPEDLGLIRATTPTTKSPSRSSTRGYPSSRRPPTTGPERLKTSFTSAPTTQPLVTTETQPQRPLDPSEYEIECMNSGFRISVKTNEPFKGWMFVKDRFDQSECAADHQYPSTNQYEASISIGFGTCGVSKRRMFVRKGDRAFKIRCFYAAEMEKRVNSTLLFPDSIPTENIDVTAAMPTCEYSLHRDTRNGPRVKFVEVGTRVYHRWDCDPSAVYGILVHSCAVTDPRQTQTVPIIDEKGCVSDKIVMEQLTYSDRSTIDAAYSLSAFASTRAFGFPDSRTMKFQCQIKFCLKIDGGCDNVTPPQCSEFRRGRRSIFTAISEDDGGEDDIVETHLTVIDSFTESVHRNHSALRGRVAAEYEDQFGAVTSVLKQEVCLPIHAFIISLLTGLSALFVWIVSGYIVLRNRSRRNWLSK